ncbi:DMT family transporter [Halomonas denitrificans]
MTRPRIVLLTCVALVAFAANSLLTRAALDGTAIDPLTFTAVRLASGALVLALLVRVRIERAGARGSWVSAAALFAYALLFSLAYRGLTAATGALLLFGAVQVTMLAVALARGDRLGTRQWAGLAAALGGIAWLLWPGIAAPPLAAAMSMAGAGVAWGIYTLRARGGGDPTAVTAANFVRATVPALVLLGIFATAVRWDPRGITLAVASGAMASGLGYAVWYAALRQIGTHSAAVAQLAVPVITAFGGVALLAEPLDGRLVGSGILVLVGIGLVALCGRKDASRRT